MEAEHIYKMTVQRLDALEKTVERRFAELENSMTKLFRTVHGNGLALGLKASVAVLDDRVRELKADLARSGHRRWDLGRTAITAVVAIVVAAISAVVTVTLTG